MFNQSLFNQTKFGSLQNNVHSEAGLAISVNSFLSETDNLSMSEQCMLILFMQLSEFDTEEINNQYNELDLLIQTIAKTGSSSWSGMSEVRKALVIASVTTEKDMQAMHELAHGSISKVCQSESDNLSAMELRNINIKSLVSNINYQIYQSLGLSQAISSIVSEYDGYAFNDLARSILFLATISEKDSLSLSDIVNAIVSHAIIKGQSTSAYNELANSITTAAKIVAISTAVSNELYASIHSLVSTGGFDGITYHDLASLILISSAQECYDSTTLSENLYTVVNAVTDESNIQTMIELGLLEDIVSVLGERDTHVLSNSPHIASTGFNPAPHIAGSSITPELSRIYPVSSAVSKF